MAYERISTTKIKGDSLDAFVQNSLKQYQNQLAVRNAEDESRFAEEVLNNNIPLEDQLAYRSEQLKRISDDPEERRRVRAEIASLKDRIEQKTYADGYLQKIMDYNNGSSSIDSIIEYLETQKASITDPTIKADIEKQLSTQYLAKFNLQKDLLKDQTEFAVKDKSTDVINTQISRVNSAKSKALLAGNSELAATYDLQLQSLNQALSENNISKSIMSFATATLTGASNAVSLLDSYNGKITTSSDNTGPVTIGGVRYDSEKAYWTNQRDQYISDQGGNGFFKRLENEQLSTIRTKNSQNLLSLSDLNTAKSTIASLTGRPELANYVQQINNTQSSILQNAADLQATKIYNDYSNDYDVNKAFNSLATLKAIGVNVDAVSSKILNDAGSIKNAQVQNILQVAQQLLKSNPGMDPVEAVNQATSAGAGVALSPTQLAQKNESQIATEAATAAKNGSFQTDPRTTVNQPQNAPAPVVQQPAPPIAPAVQDLSNKYGQVGSTIYRKSDNHAFSNQQEFFADSGLNSFQNTKFDTSYQPSIPNASPQLNTQLPTTPQAPTASPVTYKVNSGDTLSAIAQKYLGDAKRYNEIAKANNISNPNQIKVGQILNIPG